jgi:hypothetical protein
LNPNTWTYVGLDILVVLRKDFPTLPFKTFLSKNTFSKHDSKP